jgi:hypothetical protein
LRIAQRACPLIRKAAILEKDISVKIHRTEIVVSDRTTLRGLTQFPRRSLEARPQTAEYKLHHGTLGFEGGFCDNQIQAARSR